MTLSERARGRTGDLRGSVLSRLREHSPLTDLLEAAETIDNGTEVIMPASVLDIQHRTDGASPPDVALGISVVTSSSNRENRQERKNHVVQADLQLRDRALKRQGPAWIDDISDEIAAVLTAHADGWVASGVTGGTNEPLWDEDLNRYRSVQRFDIEHWG